jgi:lincosamide nucleotidyltransferase A/C/D/E
VTFSFHVGRPLRVLVTAAARTARVAVALLDPVYLWLTHSRVSGLLKSRPLQWLRRRMIPGMAATDVLYVLDLLDRADVPCWLVGGWGVDALVGRQTRRHTDVDVALDRRFLQRALNSLNRAGYHVLEQKVLPVWMPAMLILRDASRRRIELMPVDIPEPPPGEDGRPEEMRFRYTADSITTGTVNGCTVPCLAAPVQLMFHTNYPPRDSDRHDVRVLVERFRLPAPAGYS